MACFENKSQSTPWPEPAPLLKGQEPIRLHDVQELEEGQGLTGQLVSLEPHKERQKVLVRTQQFVIWPPIRYESRLRKLIGKRIGIFRAGDDYRFKVVPEAPA